jgi:hypothetical protein
VRGDISTFLGINPHNERMPDFAAYVRPKNGLFFVRRNVRISPECIVINASGMWRTSHTRVLPDTYELTSGCARIRFLSSADFEAATRQLFCRPTSLVAAI